MKNTIVASYHFHLPVTEIVLCFKISRHISVDKEDVLIYIFLDIASYSTWTKYCFIIWCSGGLVMAVLLYIIIVWSILSVWKLQLMQVISHQDTLGEKQLDLMCRVLSIFRPLRDVCEVQEGLKLLAKMQWTHNEEQSLHESIHSVELLDDKVVVWVEISAFPASF